MLIAPTGEIEPGACWLLAESLYLDGLYAGQVGNVDRGLDSLAKARMLFSLLKPMGAFLVGFPEAEARIQEIDINPLMVLPEGRGTVAVDARVILREKQE